MIVTIGIDPGLHGAVGFLLDGEYLHVSDIPTMLKGSGSVKYELDPAGLRRELLNNIDPRYSCRALLERVNAMPGQGVSSMFSLGDSFGCCRSVLACTNTSFETIPPAKWKKYFGLVSDKEAARALAIKLFPEAPLHLKKYVDRAEALLISRYLWETEFK